MNPRAGFPLRVDRLHPSRLFLRPQPREAFRPRRARRDRGRRLRPRRARLVAPARPASPARSTGTTTTTACSCASSIGARVKAAGSPMARRACWIVAGCAFASLLVCCNKPEPKPVESQPTPPPPAIVTNPSAPVKPPPPTSPRLPEMVATIRGDGEIPVKPSQAGYLVRQVYQDGAMVAAGDVLFLLDEIRMPIPRPATRKTPRWSRSSRPAPASPPTRCTAPAIASRPATSSQTSRKSTTSSRNRLSPMPWRAISRAT